MIALIDCNNFFVSCERHFNPALLAQPVVVLSNNDGCVISRSQEAKQLGVPMGLPLFKLRDNPAFTSVITISSSQALYRDMSQRVMWRIRQEGLPMEIYSVDECFVRVDALSDPHHWARYLRRKIWQDIGIPVSIGIAPSKTLAKVAGYWAKRQPKSHGVISIHSPQLQAKALSQLPIGEIWGIGRRHAKRLEQMGIHTASQFASMPKGIVQSLLTITGARTQQELLGIESIPFAPDRPRQSLSISRSLAKETNSHEILSACLCAFISKAAQQLRKEQLRAGELSIQLVGNRFRHPEECPIASLSRTFNPPTNDTLELNAATQALLRRAADPKTAYKKVGICLTQLTSQPITANLFDPIDRMRRDRLLQSIDTIHAQFGSQSLLIASQIQCDTSKLSRRKHATSAYTQSLADIPKASTY